MHGTRDPYKDPTTDVGLKDVAMISVEGRESSQCTIVDGSSQPQPDFRGHTAHGHDSVAVQKKY